MMIRKTLTIIAIHALILAFFSDVVSAQSDFWQPTNPSLPPTHVAKLTIDGQRNIFAGETTGGIYRSADQGESWIRLRSGLPPAGFVSVTALQSSPSDGLYATFSTLTDFLIYYSADHGENWQEIGKNVTGSRILSMAFNLSGDFFIGTESEGVFRSSDNGTSWTQINIGLTDLAISAIEITTGGDIFVATAGASIFRSTDNGQFWRQVYSHSQSSNMKALAVQSNGAIWAAHNNSVLVSKDNGNSWNAITSLSTFWRITDIALDAENNIFVSTFGEGIHLSEDAGLTWRQENSGLTNEFVETLVINNQNIVFAGTLGGGIFRSASMTTAISETPNSDPATYSLHQNYPNPFNPSTNIRYDLPTSAQVSVAIYTVLGEKVRTLIAGQQPAGAHTVQWDGRDEAGVQVASGVYFCRLAARGATGAQQQFTQSRKLLLLR